mmetsp:Transcript_29545/g.38197  ORF Transcript_29545/g.38197 Transcript_29545/m.38197 type:complete len:218 (-) Transcript_29545:296-949(-)
MSKENHKEEKPSGFNIVQLKKLDIKTRKNGYGKLQSLDDIDLENQTATNQHAVLFLKHKVDKIWKTLEQINETLYHEDTATIVREKPIFDKEKKKLVMLSTLVEKQLDAGNFLRLKEDFNSDDYSPNLLKTATNFANWNSLASEINQLIREIQRIDKVEKAFRLLENASCKNVKPLLQKNNPKRRSKRWLLFLIFALLTSGICFVLYYWLLLGHPLW